MNIRIIETIPALILKEHIKMTPLSLIRDIGDLKQSTELQNNGDEYAKDKSIFPYETSTLEILLVNPSEVQPTSYYELNSGSKKQREIRQNILVNNGIDIFLLGTGIFSEEFKDISGLIVSNDNKIYTIIPTISEYPFSKNYGDETRLLLNDGHHRMKEGMYLDSKVSTFAIKDVTTPFYALPNPEGWNQVKSVDEIPSIKKGYTSSDPYSLYRNFNHGFVLPNYFPILKEKGVIISAPR